jgi:hypothetical protein
MPAELELDALRPQPCRALEVGAGLRQHDAPSTAGDELRRSDTASRRTDDDDPAAADRERTLT